MAIRAQKRSLLGWWWFRYSRDPPKIAGRRVGINGPSSWALIAAKGGLFPESLPSGYRGGGNAINKESLFAIRAQKGCLAGWWWFRYLHDPSEIAGMDILLPDASRARYRSG